MASTKQPELSLERFTALVEAYGGDLERFPQRERAAAKALVLRSPEARGLLEAARALDTLLASARSGGGPPVELMSTLSAIPSRHRQERTPLLPFRSRGLAGLAAAAALALGLVSGGVSPAEYASEDETMIAADISALAFADDLFEQLAVDLLDEGDAP